jgi:small-conductance mechanosensitive channel
MPVTTDIVATYRGPGRMTSRLFEMGRREDRALIFALLGGMLTFVAFAPYQARLAHLDASVPLMARLFWSGFFWIFIWPLLLYLLAALVWGLGKLARRGLSGYGARLSLFWAYLAATPLALLTGMVAGFIGPGPALQAVGILWFAVFIWFWGAGLRRAERQR